MASRSRNARRARGSALAIALMFIMVISAAALMLTNFSQAGSARASNDRDLDTVATIGEGALAFIGEQWRRDPTFLDITSADANGWAQLTISQGPGVAAPRIGTWYRLGGGRFTIVGIRDVPLGGVADAAKEVRVFTEYRGLRYTWEALISPNTSSPIAGVGTSGNQSWSGGQFTTLGGGNAGALFGNGNISISGAGTSITGDVTAKGTASAPTGGATISGTRTSGGPTIDFPDQSAIVNAKVGAVAAKKNMAVWTDTRAELINPSNVITPPTAMEIFNADTTKMNVSGSSIWSGANQLKQKHVMIKGGNITLPAGNYAFGRLWLDGATLTIKAPASDGMLVLPDIYLVNGARLIIDASDGPFTTVTGDNNAYANGAGALTGSTAMTFNATTSAEKWNSATNSWTSATSTTTKMTGDSGAWTSAGGGGGNSGMSGNGAKRYGGQSGGVTPYYDDWMVNDSVFAVVTGSPSAKGMDNYNQGDVDLTVKNNARIMAGVPAGSLSALQDPASTLATLDALEQHAMGFQQWSAGGSNPRQDIFDNSKFTGLSYGGTNAYWGSTASYTGAFVGKSVTNTGMPFQFDSELTRLLTAPASNSQHVVLKRRVANPSPAVLALLPAS